MTRHPLIQRIRTHVATGAKPPCRALLRTIWCVLLAFVVARASPAWADIYAWNTSQVIPGTQGITPGPGIDLSGWNTSGHQLEFAALNSTDLTNASFATSDLTSADFSSSNLTNSTLYSATLNSASFANANLANVYFFSSTLTNANFAGAIITGANFYNSQGFTVNQLVSTTSYSSGNLMGITFPKGIDLTGVNFANQNLTGAQINSSTLTNANFSGAIITGAHFLSSGFTTSQFYSTATYASGNLSGIDLSYNDLTGWNFANQNLTSAILYQTTLTNANFSGATITGADLEHAQGFTASQLSSTASYPSGNLMGVTFPNMIDLTGVNFANKNLTNAKFYHVNLTNANFSGAIIAGASFVNSGLTAGQLYSTASYASDGLTDIILENSNLTGWNFANKNLANADFNSSILTNANLTNANLNNATFELTTLTSANFTDADLRGAGSWSPVGSTTTRNTIRPDGSIQGLALLATEKLVIRNYPLAITVNTSASLAPNSTLQFLLADNWTSSIGFSPGLTPSLGGALDLEFAAGVNVNSEVGHTFDLLNWTGVTSSGAFTISGPYQWDLSQLYTTGNVTLLSVPEPSTLALAGCGLAALVLAIRRRATVSAISLMTNPEPLTLAHFPRERE